jgi:hypothetical protein
MPTPTSLLVLLLSLDTLYSLYTLLFQFISLILMTHLFPSALEWGAPRTH